MVRRYMRDPATLADLASRYNPAEREVEDWTEPLKWHTETGDIRRGRRMPENRVCNPEFKLAAVQRLVAGEKVKALAEEFGLSRQLLYKWWTQYERAGPAALRLPARS